MNMGRLGRALIFGGINMLVLFVLLNYIWLNTDTNKFLLNKGNGMVVRRQ